MLTLSRNPGDEILIGDDIRVIVKNVRGNKVRIGIVAPKSVRILRSELPVEKEPTVEHSTTTSHAD